MNGEEKIINYQKCDVCGKLKCEEDLEEITIVIKKCRGKDCIVSDEVIEEGFGKRKPPKSLGGGYGKPPMHIAEAFNPPPED